MLCSELANKIDDFLDGNLAAEEAAQLQAHAEQCAVCGPLLAERTALARELAELPVDAPAPDFFDRALATAAAAQSPAPRSWFSQTSRGVAAIAATLLVAVVLLQAPVFMPSSEIPEVTITLHEVTPVNLRFASEVDLQDARLSLQLPEGVAVAGYNDRKTLSWRTDLKAGNNLLELPLLGYVASTDRLTAQLDHPNGRKTFALQITVN